MFRNALRQSSRAVGVVAAGRVSVVSVFPARPKATLRKKIFGTPGIDIARAMAAMCTHWNLGPGSSIELFVDLPESQSELFELFRACRGSP
jgi:hypothetical protein